MVITKALREDPMYDEGPEIEGALRSWLEVERGNGKCVGISTGEQLYDRHALTKNRGTLSFFDSRLSVVDSTHPSIAASAALLAARAALGVKVILMPPYIYKIYRVA